MTIDLQKISGTPDTDEITNFLTEPLSRELCDYSDYDEHGNKVVIFSIDNFTDDEINEAIIQDILAATMIEKECNRKFVFDLKEMLKFTSEVNHVRIVSALHSLEVMDVITQDGGEYRIRDDKRSLQWAMDFCGVYYEGFDWPDDVLMINRQALSEISPSALLTQLEVDEDPETRINAPFSYRVQ